MKTREIRDRIKAVGFERGAVYCLEAINEELIQTRRDLNEMAAYFDQLVNAMGGMITVSERMKEYLDQHKMRHGELGPNTHALGDDE